MHLISLRLPKSLINKIDKTAKLKKQNRSAFIRSVLENSVTGEREIKSDRLTEVRDELLLAVGQLGDSLRQLPKFIKEAESGAFSNVPLTNVVKKTAKVDRASAQKVDVPTAKKAIKPTPVSPTKTGVETPVQPPIQSSEIGWSNMTNSKPELTLRPRQEPVPYGVKATKTEIQSDQDSVSNQSTKAMVSEVVSSVEGPDQRKERRRGQLKGRPIGEERRQSIRLARVLAYKKWDARRLAERLRMPIEIIEHAIEGRKDLASLKVEALLSTWEEEMQHVGWKPDAAERRN